MPVPVGIRSVSPSTTAIFSNGRPSHSLTIWLKAVACAWPFAIAPENTVTEPSASNRMRAPSPSPAPPPQRSI